MDENKIGSFECISLIIVVSTIPLILVFPTFIAENFGTGSMFHVVTAIIVATFIFTSFYKLLSKFPKKNIVDVSEYVGGKALKIITGIFAIAYLYATLTLILSEFNADMRNILFDDAPSKYTLIIFWVGILIGVFSRNEWNI